MSDDNTPAPINAPKVLFFRRPYETERFSCPQGFDPDEDLTRQEFAEECDVNTIMARYQKTGVMPQGDRQPSYDDYSDVTDYQSALNKIIEAEEAFFDLPSRIRERFKNDPAEYVSAIQQAQTDDKVKSELVDLGILRPPAPAASSVPPAPPSAEPTPGAAGEQA